MAPRPAHEQYKSARSPKPAAACARRRIPGRGLQTKLKTRRYTIPNFQRHSSKCQICHHKKIDAIEEAFVNHASARRIVEAFNLGGRDVLYRHARVTGLNELRRQNVRAAVERLLEEVDYVKVTGSMIISAVRALSCVDRGGKWTDPPSVRIVLSRERRTARNSNRDTYGKLESNVND